jgi:hypothetical protein
MADTKNTNESLDTSPPKSDYYEGEITQLSIKAIEVYQIQGQLVSRLWAYFNQYTSMLVLIGLAAVAFRDTVIIKNLPNTFAAIVGAAYLIFSFGNHQALSHAADELFILRNIATLQTRLNFRGFNKGETLRYHLLLIIVSLVIYIVFWLYAKGFF